MHLILREDTYAIVDVSDYREPFMLYDDKET